MIAEDLASGTHERPIRVGRYDVVGLIGAGGMGAVYDAIDREHRTRVALKTLSHLSAANLLLFKSEFRSVADLSHPNLVSLYELSCHDDLWFFTMERIDGGDFVSALRRSPPTDDLEAETTLDAPVTATVREREPAPAHLSKLTPPASVERLRDAFAQLVRGVRALHAAGLLHLDIKPSNVLIDDGGRVVVVDFGLVRAIGESPPPHRKAVYGTPGWMAPEQDAGAAIGPAADWYAVGLLLYRALAGVSPIDESAVITPPDQLIPGLPKDLCELAVALLHSDPAWRPTGDDIAGHLFGDSAAPMPARASSRLVGRAVERAHLAETLGLVREGGSAVVHLVGPSGVGKTTLLASLLDEARDGGIVLRGRCYERESVPYKAFDGMLDQLAAWMVERPEETIELPGWIAELSRVFPVLTNVPAIAARIAQGRGARALEHLRAEHPLELRRRAMEALRELVGSLAARRPVLLAIDDLHWGDADSASLLAKLLEAPRPRGLLVVATYREAEAQANPAIAAYVEMHDAQRLVVGPLGETEAERLASATLASLDVKVEGLARAIAEEAAGNPFYVEELAYDVGRRSAEGACFSAGGALEGLLARRVESLSTTERSLLEVLAVASHPIPLSVSFAVAAQPSRAEGKLRPDGGTLRALWSLRSGHFVRSTGARDHAELHHDGMRAAVLASMSKGRQDQLHLALGRAFRESGSSASIFDAARHFASVPSLLAFDERIAAAHLQLEAGRKARLGAAFPLAFACFRAGSELLRPEDWEHEYALALALESGAAEAAYLASEWERLDGHVAEVKARGRTILDQLGAWEVQIDACIARRAYDTAVDVAIEALGLLDVSLPARPTENEVGRELQAAMVALARVAEAGLASRPDATDAKIIAAMRIEARVSSAAYFARPMLLPVIACRLVATSALHGLSSATPYALSVYGIVLNSLGMLAEAHECGQVALALLDRFDDESFEARTRHVVHDLVCSWITPLERTLDDLREVVTIGRATGDLEYASYAAHAYVHNAFYAARELETLLVDALAYGELLRGYQQVNALHVHLPFEQLLRCFTGRTANPASLDGDGFEERAALAIAEASGSRSARCIVQLLMGIVRYHFGSIEEASACFEAARPFLDGVVSTWHIPILHQYAALAIHALPGARGLRDAADASLAALKALAAAGPENFEHRVRLVEAERARADDDLDGALVHALAAIAGAEKNGFTNDVALGHELAARCHVERSDAAAAAKHSRAAGAAYQRWGARAKIL